MICLWDKKDFDKLPEVVIKDILSALDHGYGERGIEDVFDDLALDNKQLWLVDCDGKFVATVITHILEYPRKKTCEICYLGGNNMLNSVSDIKHIEVWAKHQGCKDIQIIGRRGWLRALKDEGYLERYTTIGKEL